MAGSDASQREPILRAEGLVKHFPLRAGLLFRGRLGAVRAVDDVSFELYEGQTLGLVGESGCGKSTLGRLLVRLEKPTAGTVYYRGTDIFSLSRRERRAICRRIQIVFQDPYASLNPRMTIGEIIADAWAIHPGVLAKDERRGRVEELLRLVGLDPVDAGRYPHEFSGGQRQRVGIARALALQPEILVCDEPVSSLDVSIQAQVVNLLERLQDELGLAYIFIAHDLSLVRHISDRVAIMYLGKIVEHGDHEQIYERSTHPYTQALLSAVPEPDPSEQGFVNAIELQGDVPSPVDPPSGCRFRTRCWKAERLCADEVPALDKRGFDHPSACHFAELPAPALAKRPTA